MTVTRDFEKRGHHHQPEVLYGGRGTALRYETLQSRVNHQSKAGTDPEPTGGETAERRGKAAPPGNHWSCDVPRISHPLRNPLRGQPAIEGRVQARES